MAAIYKRGKTWWGRFRYQGREYRRSLETGSRVLANKRLDAWQEQVKNEAFGIARDYTFDEGMLSFLMNHCPTLKPSSATRYKMSGRALEPFFAGMKLAEITSSTLADYEAERRRQGVSAPTIRRDLACLSSMFSHVNYDLEWMDYNPVLPFLKRQKRRGRLKESPPKTRYLTEAEEAALLEACKTASSNAFHDQVAFAIDTGLRAAEQWGLTWAQVDLRKGDIVITPEKSKSGRERIVRLEPRAAQIMAQTKRRSEYVFVNSKGEPYQRRGKRLLAAATKAGIAPLTWHDLRRTRGCRLLQQKGWQMHEVSRALGHHSVQQTERAYAFVDEEALRNRVSETIAGTENMDYDIRE